MDPQVRPKPRTQKASRAHYDIITADSEVVKMRVNGSALLENKWKERKWKGTFKIKKQEAISQRKMA